MSETELLAAAVARVEARLIKAHADNRRRGMQDHWLTLVVLIAIFSCSAASAITGIVYKLPQVTGVLGVLPGILAIAANMLKLQGKAHWHERKANAAGRLVAKLRDEKLQPTEKYVARISQEWGDVEAAMQKEWEKLFSVNFAEFQGRHSHIEADDANIEDHPARIQTLAQAVVKPGHDNQGSGDPSPTTPP